MLKLQNVQSKTTFYTVFHFQEAIKCGREQECDNGLYCVREWRFRNQNKVENQLDLNRKISRHVPKIKPPPKIGKSKLEKYKPQSVCEKNEKTKKGFKNEQISHTFISFTRKQQRPAAMEQSQLGFINDWEGRTEIQYPTRPELG